MELSAIAQRVIELARKAGADEAEVLVRSGQEFTAKVRLGKVEVLQEARSYALGLRLFSKLRSSTSYTSDLSEQALPGFVAETLALCELGEPDDLYRLPDGPFADPAHFLDLDTYDPAVLQVSAEERIRLATEAEAAALAFDPRITNSDGASCDTAVGASAFANSAGFLGTSRGTYQSLAVEAIADDAEGKKRNASDWTGARHLSDLKSPAHIGRRAAEKALRKLGARKVATCEAPVVFEADAARALLSLLFSVISGGAIYRRSSYLLDREGSRVASPLVTVTDDPHRPRGSGSRNYDGDGLPTRRNVVVQDGILQTYLLDTYSARKLGRQSTGSAGRSVGGTPGVTSSNFYLAAGQTKAEDLLSGIARGLYVTSMMGFGFNPVTGDLSRGAAGFWIEDGKLAFPVSEVTISANLDDLWQRIDAVGDDLEFKSGISCPSLRVSSMTIAGK